jgi:transposase
VVDGARERHLMCHAGSVNDPAEEPSTMDKITTIGLDIAKNSFAVHGFDAEGRTVLKKELKRAQVEPFFSRLEACRVGLEACASAHHWARQLKRLGHDARLIPAGRVKAFVPRHKNDAADAQAIARAVREPEMRLVAVKTVAQQAALMLFKSRDLLIGQRTQLLNALRGHFGEIGIVVPKGAHQVRTLVDKVMIAEKAHVLPEAMRAALRALVAALFALGAEIAQLDKAIMKVHRGDATSRRLATVPGIGTLTATVLSATVSDPHSFSGGREFAAWIGLVPRQHSTGGKPRLGHISKMGNRDLRRLLVVGAHAALYRMKSGKTQSPLADWARRLLDKKPFKLVAVALANKMARIAWAIMAKAMSYDRAHMVVKPA